MDGESSEGLVVENRIYNIDIGAIASNLARQTKTQTKERELEIQAFIDSRSKADLESFFFVEEEYGPETTKKRKMVICNKRLSEMLQIREEDKWKLISISEVKRYKKAVDILYKLLT